MISSPSEDTPGMRVSRYLCRITAVSRWHIHSETAALIASLGRFYAPDLSGRNADVAGRLVRVHWTVPFSRGATCRATGAVATARNSRLQFRLRLFRRVGGASASPNSGDRRHRAERHSDRYRRPKADRGNAYDR